MFAYHIERGGLKVHCEYMCTVSTGVLWVQVWVQVYCEYRCTVSTGVLWVQVYCEYRCTVRTYVLWVYVYCEYMCTVSTGVSTGVLKCTVYFFWVPYCRHPSPTLSHLLPYLLPSSRFPPTPSPAYPWEALIPAVFMAIILRGYQQTQIMPP